MQFTGANRLMDGRAGRFDGHAHVFRADLPMTPDRRYTPGYDATLPDFVAVLRGHGMDGALLVQPSFLGTDNRHLLSALEAGKAMDALTLRGIVMLDPGASAEHIADLSSQGIIGMRLNLVGGAARDFDIAPWDGVLRRIDAAGWHVELHCEGVLLPPLIDALLARCRTVVVDHFGLPGSAEPAECSGYRAIADAPTGRVMVKASAPYRVFPKLSFDDAAARCRPILDNLSEALGPECLIVGSDWPWTRFENRHRYADAIAWFDAGNVRRSTLDYSLHSRQ